MTTQTFGKYVVTQLLGRGGMAEVYRAHHPVLDREVAIKVIHPHLATEEGFTERFRREAKLVASLRHPHIVQLHDFDVVNPSAPSAGQAQPFMVMEYLGGGTLKDRLAQCRARGETLPLDEIARLIEPIASALDYAHTQGAIHRDIKPANILFTSQGEAVLTDFGIAKILGESLQISVSGNIIGTPAYMSPEQAASKPVEARSDLYSLGVVLYEMATGRVPFQGDSLTAVMMQHLTAPPPPPRQFNPNLPEAVQTVILQSLAKDPDARFATASEMARAFSAALRGETPVQVSPEAATVREQQAATVVPSVPVSLRLRVSVSLFSAMILALLGVLFAAAQFFGLDTRLPTALVGILPFLVAMLFAGSAVASLIGIARAGSRTQQWQAMAMLAVALVVGAGLSGWMMYDRLQPPKKAVALIADFDAPQARRGLDMGGRIAQEAQARVQQLKMDNVVDVKQSHETYRDAAAARAAGETRKATLVIWGSYDDEGVNPHFELLRTIAPYETGLRRSVDLKTFYLSVKAGTEETTYIVLLILGLARYAEGVYADAAVLFDQALAAAPTASVTLGKEVTYFYKGNALGYQGDLGGAIEAWRKAVETKPDLVEARYNLALAYTDYCAPALMLDQALVEAQKAIALKPNDASAYQALGQVYAARREWNAALPAYQRAVSLQPGAASAHGALGRLYRQIGQRDQARTEFEQVLAQRQKALANAVDQAAARSELGAAYFDLEQYDKAAAEYQTAIQLAPTIPDYYRQLGNAYYWLRRFDDAAIAFRKVLQLLPRDATTHELLGSLYAEQRHANDAITEYREATRLNPCSVGAYRLLAGLYVQQGDLEKALEAYAKAVEIDPRDARSHYLLGGLYYQRGEWSNAAKALQAATQLEPSDAATHYTLGSVYYQQKEYAKAVTEYEAAVKNAPQEAEYWDSLSSALGKVNRWQDALQASLKATQLKSDEPLYWIHLGNAYGGLSQWSDAARAYTQATTLKPDEPLYHRFVAAAQTQAGHLAGAADAYRAALALNDDAQTRGALAEILARQGLYAEAATEYQKAIALAPNDASLSAGLALVYVAQNRPALAATEAQKAIALQSDYALAHYALGAAYAALGNNDAAIREYQLVIRYAGTNEALKAAAEAELKRLAGK